jgi:hypothetical protein
MITVNYPLLAWSGIGFSFRIGTSVFSISIYWPDMGI